MEEKESDSIRRIKEDMIRVKEFMDRLDTAIAKEKKAFKKNVMKNTINLRK